MHTNNCMEMERAVVMWYRVRSRGEDGGRAVAAAELAAAAAVAPNRHHLAAAAAGTARAEGSIEVERSATQTKPAKEKEASNADITARVPWAAVSSSITREFVSS
jgi:hypothetical protein